MIIKILRYNYLILYVISYACLFSFIASFTVSATPVNATNLIYPIEDYDVVGTYVKLMHKQLESKLPVKSGDSKDWALTSFIISRNGTITNTTICNSTGNKKFNQKALKILGSTKLSALPAECGDKVKATHAFGWERAIKNSANSKKKDSEWQQDETTTSATDNHVPTHERAKEIVKSLCKLTGEPYQQSENLANLEALVNIALNLAEISYYLLFAWIILGSFGSVVPCFFIAGIIWWLHRILLGRFPA